MESFLDWLKEKGTFISMEGNKPLLMTEEHKIYILIDGKIDIFAVKVKNNEAVGARNFLFEVYREQAIFPILSQHEEQFGFLLSGKIGTTLAVIDKKDFMLYVKKEENISFFVNMMNQWVLNLAKSMTIEIPPRIFNTIPRGIETSVKSGEILRTKEELLWIHYEKGKALVNEKHQICEETFFPLTEFTWINVLEDSVVSGLSTEDLFQKQLIFSALNIFHRKAIDVINNLLELKRQQQKQQFKEKLQNDQWVTQKSILQLAAVTETYDEGRLLGEKTDVDPLLTVCTMVGNAMKIKIDESVGTEKLKASKDPLKEIANTSNIHIRKVVLNGKWYKNDNGPMVAYMEADHRPVALIPVKPQQYELYDPEKKTTTIVNDQLADEINSFAYSFYRPFPNKILKVKDLLKFGLESSW
ncbi:MAG: hypothetical protein AB2421_07290, partial [Thermotaleaceae bacterium]